MVPTIQTKSDLVHFFPKKAEDMKQGVDRTIAYSQKKLLCIVSLETQKRTFENTVRPLDEAVGSLQVMSALLQTTQYTSPSQEMRTAAEKEFVRLQNYMIDQVANNRDLYLALHAYADSGAKKEHLTQEQQYYLADTVKDFERAGLGLPEKEREKVKQLQKQIVQLSLEFESNIFSKTGTVSCTRNELAGLSESFIAGLQHAKDHFLLRLDMPTYEAVMPNCTVEKTRERFWLAYNNRAFPENENVLASLITARDQLARLLGYPSFAALNLENQMAKSPERVSQFLDTIEPRANEKYRHEMELLKAHLPTNARLANGKFKPWDYLYVLDQYKKRYLSVDSNLVAEYFPATETIDKILKLFSSFFGLEFCQEQNTGLWHSDVRCIAVCNQEHERVGYLLLDLFPRDGKYSHAAQINIIPGLKTATRERRYPVVLIMANFPKANPLHPALLKLTDVETFFHEFGHAMHSLLGTATLMGFSPRVDYIEVPSQTLEAWPTEPVILKKISGHYKTNEQLPDELIERLRTIKKCDSGYRTLLLIARARYALACFGPGEKKDLATVRHLLQAPFDQYISEDPRSHFECAFIHLTNYEARYYGYLWSLVWAYDLFDIIKRMGFLNKGTGQWFNQMVLSKGISNEPDMIMHEVFGREMSPEAFYTNLGL